MKISVSGIGDDGIHIHEQMDPSWLENVPELSSGEEGTRLISNIDIDIELTRVLREITILGNVSFSIESPCSRCLEAVELDLKPEIRLVLSPSDKIQDEEDENHETYSGEEIDISDYLRERIAISLPVKVICSEECRGLCPKCGINLNKETCDCEKDRIDPRFAALKKLKI